ncbi:MAG: DUF1640 domain-containing protein [Nitrospinae bacterium]|nr:DUF1640 domain-containing protein [Nitrospinota bacterium]MBI3813249.1 DUF1640 domain-containing protein [Nitrospinota bacterium]
MTVATFDTLRFVKKLKEAGVSEKQAEAEAEAISEVFEVTLSDIATKGDIKELKRDIKELELRLDGEIKLLKWMMGVILAGVVSLVLKAFFM